MRIYVMTDMEGASGVCLSDHVRGDGALYQYGRKFLTMDVNACVEGLFAGGATEVVVRDAHGGRGANFIWEELDPRAEYIMGETGKERLAGIDDCDALVLLGFHAMAGTPEAILEHTMSSASWQNFWMNGRKCGEIGIEAALAGEHDVPTILCTGGDKACKEAEDFMPGIMTAVVKQDLCVEGGKLLSADAAHRLIAERSAECLQLIGKIDPYRVERPVTFRLERVSRGRLPIRGEKPYVKIIDGRTYEVTADSVEEALWRLY